MTNDKLQTNRNRKGFTVVELLVAVGLFTTIITIAIGAYIRVLKTQSFMTSIMSANDNVSLVLEQMMREIRTGDNLPSDGYKEDLIKFKNDEGKCVRYNFDSPSIYRSVYKPVDGLDNCQEDSSYRSEEILTSSDVLIENLNFTVKSGKGSFGDIIERVQIEVKVNVADPNSPGGKFFTDGNELKTFVSTRKYFGE